MCWGESKKNGVADPCCFQPKASDILRLFFRLETGILKDKNEVGKERRNI